MDFCLSSKKLVEAQKNVELYLKEGLLKNTNPQKQVLNILEENSLESIRAAELMLSSQISSLWAIVCSYYSMYYAANAVLYARGYKVGERISHKVTADALIVFVRDALRRQLIETYEQTRQEALAIIGADEFLDFFERERHKRGTVQYSTTEKAKRSKAETSLLRAKEFVHVMRLLLK